MLKTQGYQIFKQALDRRLLNGIRLEAQLMFRVQLARHRISGAATEAMASLLQKAPEDFKNTGKAVQNLPELYRLMVCEKLMDLVHDAGVTSPVINTKPVLFFHNRRLALEEINYKTPAHQDWASMQSSLNALVLWIPLCQIDRDMGRLEVVPESHLKGAQWLEFDNDFGRVHAYEQKDWLPLDVEMGDVLAFNAMLVHRSGDNQSEKIRWAANFRYADAAEKYWINSGYFNPYKYNSVGGGRYRPTSAEVQECLKSQASSSLLTRSAGQLD